MQITTLKPQDIHFDPVAGEFTAMVTLKEAGQTFRYPCSFAAPITMPLTIAAHRLSQQAKTRHARGSDLRSVTTQPDSQPALPRAA